jgi:hypothetical protein
VVVRSLLCLVGLVGNAAWLVWLCKRLRTGQKLRENILLLNLCIAGLFVACITMPVFIGWTVTKSWMAGDGGCRIVMFLSQIGPLLSPLVLTAVTLDRCASTLLQRHKSALDIATKVMLSVAWIIAIAACVPQVS